MYQSSIYLRLNRQHVSSQTDVFTLFNCSFPLANIHTHITPHSLCPGGYTPRSSLPCLVRRTLIFSLMSVSCRSGQKQSSAGVITTSRGIPHNTLCPMHTHRPRWRGSGAPSVRDGATSRRTKKCQSEQTEEFFLIRLVE